MQNFQQENGMIFLKIYYCEGKYIGLWGGLPNNRYLKKFLKTRVSDYELDTHTNITPILYRWLQKIIKRLPPLNYTFANLAHKNITLI